MPIIITCCGDVIITSCGDITWCGDIITCCGHIITCYDDIIISSCGDIACCGDIITCCGAIITCCGDITVLQECVCKLALTFMLDPRPPLSVGMPPQNWSAGAERHWICLHLKSHKKTCSFSTELSLQSPAKYAFCLQSECVSYIIIHFVVAQC